MFLHCDHRTCSVNMFSECKWLNIKDGVYFHEMCLVYECRNGQVPQYLAETFNNVVTSMNIIQEPKLFKSNET